MKKPLKWNLSPTQLQFACFVRAFMFVANFMWITYYRFEFNWFVRWCEITEVVSAGYVMLSVLNSPPQMRDWDSWLWAQVAFGLWAQVAKVVHMYYKGVFELVRNSKAADFGFERTAPFYIAAYVLIVWAAYEHFVEQPPKKDDGKKGRRANSSEAGEEGTRLLAAAADDC